MRNARLRVTILPIALLAAVSCGRAAAQTGAPPHHALCIASQLTAADDLTEADSIDGGVGHHTMTIAITNHSSAPCDLRGVPEITLSDLSGRRLPVEICANCNDYLFRPQPPLEVVLEPSRTAYLVLGYDINDGAGPCRTARHIGIGIARGKPMMQVAFAEGWRSCGGMDATPFLGKPTVNGFLPDPGTANGR